MIATGQKMEMVLETVYPLYLGDIKQVRILLVGCGGTGSWLAPHLGRQAYEARRKGLTVQLGFCDFDVVEEKNVGRQNFHPAHVGHGKAELLSWRVNRMYGLASMYYDQIFHIGYSDAKNFFTDQIDLNTIGYSADIDRDEILNVIVGAVDSPRSRAEIKRVVEGEPRLWWLDTGNDRFSGQVILGNDHHLTGPEINPFGFCEGLPLPSAIQPELVEFDGDKDAVPEISCVEVAAEEEQSLLVNQQAATIAACYLQHMIFGTGPSIYATFFDILNCSSGSEFIHDKRTIPG